MQQKNSVNHSADNADAYRDILHLPHPTSKKHPRMSLQARAAQFSPFAALTGHGAAIAETARMTEPRIELADWQLNRINEQLRCLAAQMKDSMHRPTIAITYFLPDERKEGGAYHTVTDRVRKINAYRQVLFLENGTEIPFVYIYQLEGEGL